MTKKPLISICIPVLNEEKNITSLYERIDKLSHKMAEKCDFEIVFTDNNSQNKTWTNLKD